MSTNFRLALTGWPLGHSLSPQLHHAALAAMGLHGEYRLLPAPPGDAAALADLLAQLRSGALHGLNVTIPHKQAVLPLLDECAPAARAIGAVNTLAMKDGRLYGDNTDAPGFLADLHAQLGRHLPATGGRALLLGAGGAARAVAYALAGAGWEVWLAARRLEQAEELAGAMAAALPYSRLHAAYLAPDDLRPLQQIDLLVNTTPLGMSPHPDASPWPEGLPFPPRAAVYDLVYNPRETRWVQAARAAGRPTVTGLGMLVEQAALALERWTGLPVPRAAMHAAVGSA